MNPGRISFKVLYLTPVFIFINHKERMEFFHLPQHLIFGSGSVSQICNGRFYRQAFRGISRKGSNEQTKKSSYNYRWFYPFDAYHIYLQPRSVSITPYPYIKKSPSHARN